LQISRLSSHDSPHSTCSLVAVLVIEQLRFVLLVLSCASYISSIFVYDQLAFSETYSVWFLVCLSTDRTATCTTCEVLSIFSLSAEFLFHLYHSHYQPHPSLHRALLDQSFGAEENRQENNQNSLDYRCLNHY